MKKKNNDTDSQGTQTLLPLETTDFYYGTWRGLFYYDVNNDKIESMEGQEGYYITFSETDIVIGNGDNIQSAKVTTSEGIQKTSDGTDYYCIYYDDQNGNPVTVILTMTHVAGAEESGVEDGDYLSVMASNNPSKYMFLEKIHE